MKLLRSFMFISMLGALAACDQYAFTTYPFPPNYATTQEVPPTSIPIPPAKYSKKHWEDTNEIIEKQKHITEADRKAITDEIDVKPEIIVEKTFGKDFNRTNLSKTYLLLFKVGSDSWRIGDYAKEFWNTDRPWENSKEVQLLVPPIYSPAYPSGHTTSSFVWAEVLAQLAPCQRANVYATAQAVAEHRKLAGAHYAHDLEGGKLLASKIVAVVTTKPEYQKDFAEAQAELRNFVVSRTGKTCCFNNR
jgi:hypothetical protein